MQLQDIIINRIRFNTSYRGAYIVGEGLTIKARFFFLFQVTGPSTGESYIKVGGF